MATQSTLTLHVVLDTTAESGDAEVVVIPRHLRVPRGVSTLQWIPFDGAPESFTFADLSPHDLFLSRDVQSNMITAEYDNRTGTGEPNYTINVTSNGQPHNTRPKPRDGGGGGAGNGGGPTIKNN